MIVTIVKSAVANKNKYIDSNGHIIVNTTKPRLNKIVIVIIMTSDNLFTSSSILYYDSVREDLFINDVYRLNQALYSEHR